MKKKVLQVPVIVGKGSAQFFVEKDVTISPPSPPIFKIVDIEKKVIVTDVAVIPGKVIFNAYLWKNVIYKTVEDVCDGIVNGPIFHSTFKIPFGGFVEIDSKGDKCKEGDIAELLEAYVEGEKDYLHGETSCKGVPVFTKLLEKDVVKLVFKVVRIEHLPVLCEDYEDNGKYDNDKYDNDKYEKYEKKGIWDEDYDDKVEKKYDDKKDDDKKHDDKKGDDKKHDGKKDDDKKDYYDDRWDKRYDCRGDFYANYRGKPSKKYW